MKSRVFLIGCALALVALASPSASPAEACPPGQVGTPPYCTPEAPPNKFNLRKVSHPSTGVVTIRVWVSAAGSFTATGREMRKAKARRSAAGAFTLKLRLDSEGLARLKGSKGRQLRVAVTFAFFPSGGTSSKKVKKLIFRVVNKKKSK